MVTSPSHPLCQRCITVYRCPTHIQYMHADNALHYTVMQYTTLCCTLYSLLTISLHNNKSKHFDLNQFHFTNFAWFQCFEGLKAYKDDKGEIRMFRPDCNMERLNHSMARCAMPGQYCILSYLILPYLIIPYPIISYLIISYLIISYLIISYHIISYLILTYLTTFISSI